MSNICEVQITAHPEKADWYVATYRSGSLGAVYSVEFANTVTGAGCIEHAAHIRMKRI